MSKHIGIPIKVLHDAEGHTVTVELKTGEVFLPVHSGWPGKCMMRITDM